jgi:hypothetical protein
MNITDCVFELGKLQKKNAALRKLSDERGDEICRLWKTIDETDGKLARLVEAASLCVPDEGQTITFDDLVQHIDGLREAIAAAESGKEESNG